MPYTDILKLNIDQVIYFDNKEEIITKIEKLDAGYGITFHSRGFFVWDGIFRRCNIESGGCYS